MAAEETERQAHQTQTRIAYEVAALTGTTAAGTRYLRDVVDAAGPSALLQPKVRSYTSPWFKQTWLHMSHSLRFFLKRFSYSRSFRRQGSTGIVAAAEPEHDKIVHAAATASCAAHHPTTQVSQRGALPFLLGVLWLYFFFSQRLRFWPIFCYGCVALLPLHNFLLLVATQA